MTTAPRLLLVEFTYPDRYSQFRSRNYPYLLGQALSLGIEARWLCCFMPAGLDSRDRYVIELPEPARRALVQAMADFAPTHAVMAEKLGPALEAELHQALPGLVQENLADRRSEYIVDWPTARLPTWLGEPAPEGEGQPALLMDAVSPAYACQAVNPAPDTRPPPVHVTAGVDCAYHRGLSGNEHFEGVDLPDDVRPFGCSFCVGPRDLAYRFETRPVDLALEQIARAAACQASCLATDSFVISGARIFGRIGALFAGIESLDLRPSRFFFGCRLDEFARKADEIERLLPSLARAGHSINIFNMGIENFSPVENERLNKGLSLETIERADRAARRLEAEHPEAFGFSQWGGYGLILFTPWTKPEDLEINLKAMRRFGGIDGQGFALTSKLQILAESAIRHLAERDGLLAETFEGFHHYDSGCIFRHDQREVPWRFAHPEVAGLYDIACRIAPQTAFAADDPLLSQVQGLSAQAGQRGWTAFDLFEAALSALQRQPGLTDPAAICEQVRGLLPAEPRPPAPDRSGPATEPRPTAEDTAQEDTAAVQRARKVMAEVAASPDALMGFTPERIWEKGGGSQPRELIIELDRAGERLVLHLLARRPQTPAFLQTRRFLLRYNESTPLDSPDRERAAWVVAANLERSGLGLGQDERRDPADIRPVAEDEIPRLVAPAGGKERFDEGERGSSEP